MPLEVNFVLLIDIMLLCYATGNFTTAPLIMQLL